MLSIMVMIGLHQLDVINCPIIAAWMDALWRHVCSNYSLGHFLSLMHADGMWISAAIISFAFLVVTGIASLAHDFGPNSSEKIERKLEKQTAAKTRKENEKNFAE
jgi:ApbE superfamily uncharacterized protein (UPF0280 family)